MNQVLPKFEVTEQPSIGMPTIQMKDEPSWIKRESLVSMEPLVDIYKEILAVRADIRRLEEKLTPWYIRLYRWARGLF